MSSKSFTLFQEFLKTARVVIVDNSTSSRSRLTKTLVDMGSKRHLIFTSGSFLEAQELINDKQPDLVIADFKFKGGSGFELFTHYRKESPKNESILVMVTANTSQSIVAKAAEEDVDAYILKPYNLTGLKQSLVTAFMTKKHPSKYTQKILEGKDLMFKEGKLDEAEVCFTDAKKLHKKPSLALFYLGQVEYMREELKKAETNYNDGLEISKVHYKCQIGLYDLFMKQEKFEQAYEVVRNIIKYFPANPDRMKEIIRLAIMTRHYEDIEFYYSVFKDFEDRDPEVVNHICSGLYVLGRYYLMRRQTKKAKHVYNDLSISCAGESKFFKGMISALVEYNVKDTAQSLLKRYETEDTDDYYISKFLAFSFEYTAGEKISEALSLFNRGIKDPLCTKILLESLLEVGEMDKYQRYLDEAAYHWPDLFSLTGKSAA